MEYLMLTMKDLSRISRVMGILEGAVEDGNASDSVMKAAVILQEVLNGIVE